MNQNKPSSCKKIALYSIGAFVSIGIVLVLLGKFGIIPSPSEKKQHYVFPPLRAVNYGEEWDVDALIEKGVDVNAKNEYGETALHLAIKRGSADIVKYLVENGANSNIDDNNGISPLALTLKTGREDLTMLLLNSMDLGLVKLDWDKELIGCLARNVSKVLAAKLSENGIHIHPDVKSTIAPAIRKDDTERAKFLIDNCIGNVDGDGKFRPMWAAAEVCKPRVAQMLIDNGANVNYIDGAGWRAIHVATYNNCSEIVKMLIKYGADLNPKINIGFSALHIAAQNGRTEIAELLIANGADIELRDSGYGRTALEWASLRGHYDTAQMLIQHGANACDIFSTTAPSYAYDEGDDDDDDLTTEESQTSTIKYDHFTIKVDRQLNHGFI